MNRTSSTSRSARVRPEVNGGSRAPSGFPAPDGAPRAIQALFPTRLGLTEETRTQVIAVLAPRLADGIDLQSHCKQAHWNVKGPHFMSLHLLFDQIDGEVGRYVDTLAERIVQLGGTAHGTVRSVAAQTSLTDYPLTLSSSGEHVEALSESLARFGLAVRVGIEEMVCLKDAGSADILTEISRGVDKWLWFVEAHQQARRVSS